MIESDLGNELFQGGNYGESMLFGRILRHAPAGDHSVTLANIASLRDRLPFLDSRLKRTTDILLVLLCAPLAVILLGLAALAIKFSSRGPVFFVQERLGRYGVPFPCYKLRTMIHNAERHGPQWCVENDSRITRVGRVLRKLRLDELPQLFNVFRGEMSLVGPRPIRQHFTEMLAKEIPFYKLRLLAKPGLTGWAQVLNGHAHTNEGHSQMLQYDLYYLKEASLWLDLTTLGKTILVIVGCKGH